MTDDPDGVLVRRGVVIPARELHWRFSRSSGPGGQGVNTTDSRVELSFDVANSPSLPDDVRDRALRNLRLVDGVLTITAGDSRSQLRNRESARERLAQALREATKAPPPTRRPTKPTKGSQRRRLDQKTRRGSVKRLRGRGGWDTPE
ncbi:alternative ribosome rescue aminoacyl-tRNA hydrolase ArfB [Pseudonocardia sp. WMMC193]|uniref:alternative ribosome rescue aminoacyl-tRNA hydrolase ArfB n=1 Tax=Pseudonocardia sp. WMMC193 TaxID=2911965 RepID=UPI001F00C473|nr:alternative ribosome rescue aminoacyl-tRNA hydrolase ArfB [Pseudonocardia sp. WMMC193]MCF7551615.1 aminoacyl-tRNA hydrolase [Pseudonocardia sp. WMMC193]